MAKRLAAGVFVLSCVLQERTAHAQTALDLTWDAPPACPDRASVVASVERLVTTMPAQPLHASAVVREEEGRFSVTVEMHGSASGTRTLHAVSCASLARATALVVAIALDPEAAMVATDETAKPPPPPPPTPSPSPPVERPHLVASAGATIERALLPDIAFAAALSGGIAWRALRGEAFAAFAPSASAELGRAPSIGGDFSYFGFGLRGCGAPFALPVAVYGCASVQTTRISAEGHGATESVGQTAWVASLEPGVRLRFPARSLIGLEAGADAVVPFTRPSFVVRSSAGDERVFRIPAAGVRGSLGLGLRW